MLTKETLTILSILATNGCAGWHLLPKEAAPSPSRQLASSSPSEITQSEKAGPSSPSAEQARTNYQRAILSKVKTHWVPPTDVTLSISCNIRVEQFPDGEVISARVIDNCGSPAVEGSIIEAVYKASPLPTPEDPFLLDRELTLTFSNP